MSDPASFADPLLFALTKMAPSPSVVWHGLASDSIHGPITLARLTDASRDVRVATDNLSKTGRDISPFSAQQSERQTVLMPGTTSALLSSCSRHQRRSERSTAS